MVGLVQDFVVPWFVKFSEVLVRGVWSLSVVFSVGCSAVGYVCPWGGSCWKCKNSVLSVFANKGKLEPGPSFLKMVTLR